jgi:hypothetical protein
MERFPVELLVYGALFLAVMLFNYLRRAAGRVPQPQDAASEYEGPAEEPRSAQYESPAEFWGRVPLAAVVTSPAPTPAERVERPRPQPLRRMRYTRRSLVGSRRELRRAIVLMTVLGPCRATESSQRPSRPGHLA